MSAAAIREVAAVKLRLLKDYLDAIRSGDAKKMAQYEDIQPITVSDYIAAQFGRVASEESEFSKEAALSLEEQAVMKLLELDIPSKVARMAVKKVISKSSSGQTVAAVAKKAVKIALSLDSGGDETETVEQTGDLRNSVGDSAYDSLKNSGVIAETEDEF